MPNPNVRNNQDFRAKQFSNVEFALQKTGKWNAMHARIAWEIYHHQQKQRAEAKASSVVNTKTELLRPPGHLFGGGPTGGLGLNTPMSLPTNMPPTHPAPPQPHPVAFLSSTSSHLGRIFFRILNCTTYLKLTFNSSILF